MGLPFATPLVLACRFRVRRERVGERAEERGSLPEGLAAEVIFKSLEAILLQFLISEGQGLPSNDLCGKIE